MLSFFFLVRHSPFCLSRKVDKRSCMKGHRDGITNITLKVVVLENVRGRVHSITGVIQWSLFSIFF